MDESTVKIQLNHSCNVKGCEGNPGDIIEVTSAVADLLVDERGGAYRVDADGKRIKPVIVAQQSKSLADDNDDDALTTDDTTDGLTTGSAKATTRAGRPVK